MVTRVLRRGDGRRLAGATLAGLLALVSGPASAQGRAAAVVVAASRPVVVPPLASVDPRVAPVVVDGGMPRIRLYRPAGPEPEPLRAAVAVVATVLSVSGTAVYHPRPAVTTLDLQARVRMATGPSLTLRVVSLHHLPGKSLPLRFRGRQLRFGLGMRIPLE